MDLRIGALQNALIKNAEETKRWETYKQEHVDVEKNLKEFQKKLEIDIMVPIGSKAFMPGIICHTNEVLVCHFQGHFSQVSTHQALELVKHRVKLADDRLKSLDQEQMFYEQNLKVPMMEDAFAGSSGEQEIVEKYDEDMEKKWREQHRMSVHKMKQQEAKDRVNGKPVNSDEDIFALLEEREMIEELENELESLDIEDDDHLEKLLSGEIKPPPEKTRIAHNASTPSTTLKTESSTPLAPQPSRPTVTTYTNNNHIANQHDFHTVSNQSDDSEVDESENDDDEVPEEFKKWAETAQNMSRVEKIRFYKDKLKRIKRSIRDTRINDENDLMKRIGEIELKEVLEDTIDDLRLEEEEQEEEDEEEEEDPETEEPCPNDEKSNEKRRISFSNDVQVEYINIRDAPIQISLNNNSSLAENVAAATKPPPSDIDDLPTFEPRLDYGGGKTAQIKFKHSENVWIPPIREKDIIGNPAEIYRKVKGTQKKKDTKGKGNKGKWKEKEKKTVTEVAVAALSDVVTTPDFEPVELKSILKNCNLVEQETHHDHSNNNDVDEREEEAITQRKKKSRETFVCEAPDFSTVSF